MKMHKNARLTSKGREVLIGRRERGEYPADVAGVMGVSVHTVYKWRNRYRAERLSGLQDHSSRPGKSPGRPPDTIAARIVALRRARRVMDRAAQETGVSRATVARILRRHG